MVYDRLSAVDFAILPGQSNFLATTGSIARMTSRNILTTWLESFAPPPTRVSMRERLSAAIGALFGIAMTALICGFARQNWSLSWWMMAPMGASAVQVFCVPGSPLSQPWPMIVSHIVSALAGFASYHLLGQTTAGAACAVALATFAMLMTRSLHASGGGTALLIVLSGIGDWHFLLFPILPNMVCLVVAAMLWHRLTGHAYPQRQMIAARVHQLALHSFERGDLEAVLKSYDQTLAMGRGELESLIEMTELQAYRRMAGDRTCRDIMTAAPVRPAEGEVTVREDDPVSGLPALFSAGDLSRVLVADSESRLTGVITKPDLMAALFAV